MWSWPRSKWSSCRSRTGSRTASPPTPPGRTHILPSRTRRSPCSTSSSGSPGGRCQHGSSDSIPEPARSGAATASGVRARAQPAVPIGAGAGGRAGGGAAPARGVVPGHGEDAGLRRRGRPGLRPLPALRVPAPRRRQGRRTGGDPEQAWPARRGRVADHAHAPRDGGADGLRNQVARPRRRGHPLAPRALGRARLPIWPGRRGDPPQRAHLLGVRRLRRHDLRPALPARAAVRAGGRPDHGRHRHAVRPGHGRGVRLHRQPGGAARLAPHPLLPPPTPRTHLGSLAPIVVARLASCVMRVIVEVERSGFVESQHFGAVAVADAEGTVVAAAGDPELAIYLRSCAKPLQAMAVLGLDVERELGLGQLALAGAAGSHSGEPEHVASVRKVLAAAGLDESALRCPPALPSNREARRAAEAPAAVYHNCSGKHAYMLAGAVARGWEIERYIEPEHPLQAVVSDTVADFAGAAIEHVGVDGCGVPVHVLPLRALATAYARIGHRAAAGGGPVAALVEAARRHPVMISGTGELDTRLLEVTGGRVLGKAGAEGASAAVNLDTNQGVAVKVLDGAVRARGPALLAALAALGWLDERELEAVLPVAATPIMGGGRQVGSVRPATIELTTG